MNTQPAVQTGISAERVLLGLEQVEWICVTNKKIEAQQQAIRLFGFLNPLRPTKICLISDTELEWVHEQGGSSLQVSPAFDAEEVVLVIACAINGLAQAITDVCEKHNIALVKTTKTANTVLDFLDARLPRLIAARGVQHGVFLAVMNVGVLITGASGVGKSEVAMELVQRGHQLIADDAVEIFRSEQSKLYGECPKQLKGFIEIRGLGIINVQQMFGPSSVLDTYQLELVINLKDASESEIRSVDRLAPSLHDWEFLGLKVPCLTMLVAPVEIFRFW